MTTSIQKWGNSQGIRIPKAMLESMQWHEGERITIAIEENSLVLKKANQRKNIKELFDGYSEIYEPVKVDWGGPVGDEVW